eukprot:GHVP01019175.1.p1 GENE.GHVP01019175.1~~GHVP01019175.1.p1  ORF type:complete len:382 (+),score=62.83 GHVP01019175.1:45-1148(+)
MNLNIPVRRKKTTENDKPVNESTYRRYMTRRKAKNESASAFLKPPTESLKKSASTKPKLSRERTSSDVSVNSICSKHSSRSQSITSNDKANESFDLSSGEHNNAFLTADEAPGSDTDSSMRWVNHYDIKQIYKTPTTYRSLLTTNPWQANASPLSFDMKDEEEDNFFNVTNNYLDVPKNVIDVPRKEISRVSRSVLSPQRNFIEIEERAEEIECNSVVDEPVTDDSKPEKDESQIEAVHVACVFFGVVLVGIWKTLLQIKNEIVALQGGIGLQSTTKEIVSKSKSAASLSGSFSKLFTGLVYLLKFLMSLIGYFVKLLIRTLVIYTARLILLGAILLLLALYFLRKLRNVSAMDFYSRGNSSLDFWQ